MIKRLLLTAFCVLATSWPALATHEESPWWNSNWRFRTTVTRPAPWRGETSRPVEVVVDFAKLMAEAKTKGEFDPNSLRVIESGATGTGTETPFAYRTEYDPETHRERACLVWTGQPKKNGDGIYHIYFDTKDRHLPAAKYKSSSLPPENLVPNGGFEETAGGMPAGWTATSPELVRHGRFAHTTGERSLKIIVDENTPKEVEREFAVNRTFDVEKFAGQEMVFECDLLAERAPYGAPVSIGIEQYRADGSRILEYAVAPHWLTIQLAQGQLVQFRQRGRFNPEAATANINMRSRCTVTDADTGKTVEGPDSFFTIWLDRVVVRPGERWAWPSRTHGGYVAGALEKAPLNRAVEFTGQRRLMFNPASEGSLQTEIYNPNPRALHWGAEAGTIEFWCRPLSEIEVQEDGRNERIFLEGRAWQYELQSRLSRTVEDGESRLKFIIADADGTLHEISGPAPFNVGDWHHIAATWDFAEAHLQLFFDGRRISQLGPEKAPWPSSRFATGGARKRLGRGISLDDTRSVPRQVFVGGDMNARGDRAIEAALDEFRISDIPRYSNNFTPSRNEFVPDAATRALFHFENNANGIHDSDDRFVRGHFICELPPQEETATLEIRAADGAADRRQVIVAPYPPEEEAENASDEANTPEPTDPRFFEYVERESDYIVREADDSFILDVGGDSEPVMQSVTYEHADDTGSATVLLPHWRANRNTVPFSSESIAATLATDTSDPAERALEIFAFANDSRFYYSSRSCETLPELHRELVRWTFLKALNIYPYNDCGPLNYTFLKTFLACGISANSSLGTQHQFQHAFYDGRWRLFDISTGHFWLGRDDKTVIGMPDMEEDPYLLIRGWGGLGSFFRGAPAEALFGTAERPHNMDFCLRAGEKAQICWHNEGKWLAMMGQREPLPLGQEPPTYGNGAIVYSPVAAGDAAATENLAIASAGDTMVLSAENTEEPASLIYRLRCPYTITDAAVTGVYNTQEAEAVTLSLSFDEGETWTKVWANDEGTGAMNVSLREEVLVRYLYWLKLDLKAGSRASVSGLKVRTTFAESLFVLPGKLALGQNRITFVGGAPASPVKTTGRWLEQRQTDLGVSLDGTIGYSMLTQEPRRNLLVTSSAKAASLGVALEGRPFAGEIAVEGLPEAWFARQTATEGTKKQRGAEFQITPKDMTPGEIRGFDVVLREGEHERREPVIVLAAESPLVREAESADEVSGQVEPVKDVMASGRSVMEFTGDGSLSFKFSAPQKGAYALWICAEWKSRWGAQLTLTLDDAEPRDIAPTGLRGTNDWDRPNRAYSKSLSAFSRGGSLWYRISDVELTAGEHVLTLATGKDAEFDAMILLPQTDAMDRAAANLFHNWNYAPWRNAF